jgi:broad specificity phosphatase PhoE
MGRLLLVRHAQASFFGAHYDELSALGREQARALGEHWAAVGRRFDTVHVGPRRRHRETCEIVAGCYRDRGLPWPDARESTELDEHDGLAVIKRQLGRTDASGESMHPGERVGPERDAAVRDFFRQYTAVMRDWARGAVQVTGVESWLEFRARSLRALDVLCAGDDGARAVAFTSGGLVSSAIGSLLGLDDDRVIDLSLVLRNTGLTEVGWSGRRRRLVSFNALPHLPGPDGATVV